MNIVKKKTIGAILLATVIGGASLAGVALPANAATLEHSSASSSPAATEAGHRAHHGTRTPLTGEVAAKVTAAALAANPAATVKHVAGNTTKGTYVAQILNSDGTRATVHLDASFAVTSTTTHPPKAAGVHVKGHHGTESANPAPAPAA